MKRLMLEVFVVAWWLAWTGLAFGYGAIGLRDAWNATGFWEGTWRAVLTFLAWTGCLVARDVVCKPLAGKLNRML
jgi:hypothetical protein